MAGKAQTPEHRRKIALTKLGENNPNWKGGRIVTYKGYVMVKRPDHPRADRRGYVYEHILVAEEMLGRPLLLGEIVHHGPLGKAVNTPENLEVCPSKTEHNARHRTKGRVQRLPGEPNPLVPCACGCGERRPRYDSKGRPIRFIRGHNMLPRRPVQLALFA